MSRTIRSTMALGVCLALLAPAGASAQYLRIDKTPWTDIDDLTADSINTAVWTGWLRVPERAKVVFEIDYTRNAGTDVSVTCETADPDSDGKMPANGAGFELHKLQDTGTSGTSDSYPHIWRRPSSASGKWSWSVGVLPHNRINCSFVATAGAADDVATVRWRAVSP